MRRLAQLILSDCNGLSQVCGPVVGARWLVQIAAAFLACRRAGNLQPADISMGEGPFACRHRSGARAQLTGKQVISGIREIWVRNVYLKGDFLELPTEGTVVDLGCNMGNFTMLALGAGPGVRTISVDADRGYTSAALPKQLEANGWRERATVINAFVGGKSEFQERLASSESGGGVAWLSEDEFIERAGLKDAQIDLLKCDIEGSEFELLRPGSRLLAMTRQLAMEVHTKEGDAQALYHGLEESGFEVLIVQKSPEAEIALARRTVERARGPVTRKKAVRRADKSAA